MSTSTDMKSTREIFKTNPSLLDEPEVAQLLDYCEQLQDEIVKNKQTIIVPLTYIIVSKC